MVNFQNHICRSKSPAKMTAISRHNFQHLTSGKIDQKFSPETLHWWSLGGPVWKLCFFVLIGNSWWLSWADIFSSEPNHISGVMVSVLASHAEDRGLNLCFVKFKTLKNGVCCFSAKHAAFRSKSKERLARSLYNVSEWSDMSSCRLLLQCASTIKIGLSVSV